MTDTKHRVLPAMLVGWSHDPKEAGVAQRVFGELLKLAMPVVNHYHSDLYHDAVWLHDNITDDQDVTFFFAVRDCGTHLTQSFDWIEAVPRVNPEAIVYSIALTCDKRGAWYLLISRCDGMEREDK